MVLVWCSLVCDGIKNKMGFPATAKHFADFDYKSITDFGPFDFTKHFDMFWHVWRFVCMSG